MKTVYTDKYGLLPWAMLAVSALNFWSALQGFQAGDGNRLGLGIGTGALFAILGIKRIWDVRLAKRNGRDPTILRVEND
ncbi:hypothetical protein [Qipengyuania mesophila]|uniref:hypothetical protein n=1 Tax=Qipengyuania mesophila TaxID=2867246 RepID=UPI00351519B3